MDEHVLPRRCDETRAIQRLRRLGALSFEPAQLRLWAYAIQASDTQSIQAWLLCHRQARRALLWMGELSDQEVAPSDTGLVLAAAASPEFTSVARLWFWERLATLRRWHAEIAPQPPRAVGLPVWLGYAQGRGARRLVVLNGVSGEALPAFKPAVLSELLVQGVSHVEMPDAG